MTPQEIINKANVLGAWYHRIELTPGWFTPSYWKGEIDGQWAMIRKQRELLNYPGKCVLDVGTMDGMWAFEAEKLGASSVRAIDIWQGGFSQARSRFLCAKEIFNSKVDLREASVESDLTQISSWPYDIIQCPGVLYHLENPLLALRNMRNVVAANGMLLLETAIWKTDGAPMARFNSDLGVYNDVTTFWAMNRTCLLDALKLTGWEVFGKVRSCPVGEGPTERVCLLAHPK